MTATPGAATEPQPPSTALVVKPTAVDRSQSDLELHLLQTFAAFTGHRLAQSYRRLKHSSRVTRYVADATERVVVRAGLLTLGQVLVRQYVRLGHPVVQHVDDAMGKRVIDALVSVLMLTEPQKTRPDRGSDVLMLEAAGSARVREHEKSCLDDDDDDVSDLQELVAGVKLTYAERFQALLQGEVPRVEQALVHARRRAHVLALEKEEEARAQADKAAAARDAESPIVMELKDFVPLDEVVRLQDESKGQLQEAALETVRLRAQLTDLVHEKQRLEQRLTDVHNYQESERGRRFQDMEEALARTKLDASQKAQDLRALKLVVEAMQERKRMKKRKSRSRKATASQSNASEATLPSPQSERKAATHHHQQQQ